MVAVGLGSFLLNAGAVLLAPIPALRGWSSILWGCLIRYSAEFAMVFAAVIALNGQEWYQARFGTRGRLGSLWTFWSTGGRLVTLLLIFARSASTSRAGISTRRASISAWATIRTTSRSRRPSSSSGRTSSGATS